MLKYLNISASDWDYLIVCDGSGTSWENHIGWGAVLITKNTMTRKLFYGANNNGTNNVAELMAVLHPLSYLSNTLNWESIPQGIKVCVVTDSKYVADNMDKENPIWVSSLRLNRELWMAIHMTRRRGMSLKGFHIPRDTIALNKLSHTLANMSRVNLIGLLAKITEDPQLKPEDSMPSVAT